MNIILYELRKIFQLKRVLLLVLITGIFYYLFISFHFEYFPNGRPALDEYRITVRMLGEYGTYLDSEEFIDFEQGFEGQIHEVNEYLQSREDFVSAGMATYEDFINRAFDDEVQELRHEAWNGEKQDVFWELQEKQSMINCYVGRKDSLSRFYSPLSNSQEGRINGMLAEDKETAIFSYWVFQNYNEMIPYVAILVLISIMFMISPVFLEDRLNQVNYLQYSGKIGRRIFRKKLVSSLTASLIIITCQLLVFFIQYRQNETGMFLKANVSSIFTYFISWYDLTFMGYILLTILGTYLLGLGVTLMVAVISNRVNHYITLIGAQVPLAAIGFTLILKWLIYCMTEINMPDYFLPLLYGGIMMFATVAVIAEAKRDNKSDCIN